MGKTKDNKSITKTKEVYFNDDDPEALRQIGYDNSIVSKKGKEQRHDALIKLCLSQSLENLSIECMSIDENYRSYFIQLVRDLNKEYDCKKPSEKIIINSIALAYTHLLASTSIMQNILTLQTVHKDRTGYYSMISKDKDRAFKQYTEAMRLLIQMRQKPMKVNIKTNNAIIGENQQFNVDKKQ